MKKWALLLCGIFFLQLPSVSWAETTGEQTQRIRDLQRLFLRLQSTSGQLYTEHQALKDQVMGVKVTGEGKTYFLNNSVQTAGQKLKDLSYGNLVDLGISLRVSPTGYATGVMRLLNGNITTANVLFEAEDDFVLKIGDFALQYTPLTLLEPDVDFQRTPYLLQRQKWLGLPEERTGESRQLSGAMVEFMPADKATVNALWAITGMEDVETETFSQQLQGGRLSLVLTPHAELGFSLVRIEDNAATRQANSIARSPIFNQVLGGNIALQLLPGLNFAGELAASKYQGDAGSSFEPLSGRAYRAMLEAPVGKINLVGEFSYATPNYLALAAHPVSAELTSLQRQNYDASAIFPLGKATPNRKAAVISAGYKLKAFTLKATGTLAGEIQAADQDGELLDSGSLRSFREAELAVDGKVGPVALSATYVKGAVDRKEGALPELELKTDTAALDLKLPVAEKYNLLFALLDEAQKGTSEKRTRQVGYGVEYAFSQDTSIYVQDVFITERTAGGEQKQRTMGAEFRFLF